MLPVDNNDIDTIIDLKLSSFHVNFSRYYLYASNLFTDGEYVFGMVNMAMELKKFRRFSKNVYCLLTNINCNMTY